MLRSMIPRQLYYYTDEIYMNTLQHRNGWVIFDLDFQHWIAEKAIRDLVALFLDYVVLCMAWEQG